MSAAKGRPPFRADHVGSLLRPAALRQAFRRHAAKEIGDAEFGELQDQCIRDVVALQEEVGLQVVTDGEFRRGSYWGRFVERTEGFEIKPASFKFRNDAATRSSSPRLTPRARSAGCSRWRSTNIMFLRGATKLTGKITLPAPSTMHFYRCNDYADRAAYPDVGNHSSPILRKYSGRRSPSSRRPAAAMSSLTRSRSHFCAIRRSGTRSSDSGSEPDRARRSLHRQHQRRRRGVPVRGNQSACTCAAATSRVTISAPAATSRSPSAFSPTPKSITSCSNTIRHAPATSRRCVSCRRTKAWSSA